MPTPFSAAIVCRVSTAEQSIDGTSLDRQMEECRNLAEREGWQVVEEYIERGVSGSRPLDDRPEIQRLLSDAAAGRLDAVIWSKLDRMSRSQRKANDLLADLEKAGVEVRSVAEPLDPKTSQGRMFRDMLLRFAEFERDMFRDRSIGGTFDTAGLGRWPGGRVPYGYGLNDMQALEVREDEADIVRRIFAMRADGTPLRQVAIKLNEEGIRPRAVVDREATKEAKAQDPNAPEVMAVNGWSLTSIRHFIRQPIYMGGGITKEFAISGDRGAPRRVFEFPAPAIVEPDLWKAANVERKGRKPSAKKGKRKKNRYALSERVRHLHGDDTAPTMFGQTSTTKNKRPTRYYRCIAAKANEQRRAYCPGLGEYHGQKLTAVRADRLEAHVLRWILNTLEDTNKLTEYAQQADRLLVAQAEGEVNTKEAEARLGRLEEKKARYVDSYAEGLITKEQLDDRVKVIDAQVETLRTAMERLGDIESQRHAISVTVEQLLQMRVEDNAQRFDTQAEAAAFAGETGGVLSKTVRGWEVRDPDPNHYEEPPRGSRHWTHILRQEAERSLAPRPYGASEPLEDWVVEETQILAEALGVVVWVGERPDNPQWPKVLVGFDPTLAPFSAGLEDGPSSTWSLRVQWTGLGSCRRLRPRGPRPR